MLIWQHRSLEQLQAFDEEEAEVMNNKIARLRKGLSSERKGRIVARAAVIIA